MAASEQHEPTMEEILASIRKIISEDAASKDGEPSAEASAEDPDAPEPFAAPESEADAEPMAMADEALTPEIPTDDLAEGLVEPALAADATAEDAPEDVLDLTEVVPDDAPMTEDAPPASPDDEIGFASVDEEPAAPAPEEGASDGLADALAMDDTPAMDLPSDAVSLPGVEAETDLMSGEDAGMPDLAAEPELETETEPGLEPEPDAAEEEAAPFVEDTLPDSEMPMSEDEPAETEMPAAPQAGAGEEGLFSEESRKTLDDALANLDQAVASEEAGARGAPRLSKGEQEIGAIILDAVREKVDPAIKTWLSENRAALIEEVKPYIRAWLDENLPTLLADAMRKEVARAVKSRGTKG